MSCLSQNILLRLLHSKPNNIITLDRPIVQFTIAYEYKNNPIMPEELDASLVRQAARRSTIVQSFVLDDDDDDDDAMKEKERDHRAAAVAASSSLDASQERDAARKSFVVQSLMDDDDDDVKKEREKKSRTDGMAAMTDAMAATTPPALIATTTAGTMTSTMSVDDEIAAAETSIVAHLLIPDPEAKETSKAKGDIPSHEDRSTATTTTTTIRNSRSSAQRNSSTIRRTISGDSRYSKERTGRDEVEDPSSMVPGAYASAPFTNTTSPGNPAALDGTAGLDDSTTPLEELPPEAAPSHHTNVPSPVAAAADEGLVEARMVVDNDEEYQQPIAVGTPEDIIQKEKRLKDLRNQDATFRTWTIRLVLLLCLAVVAIVVIVILADPKGDSEEVVDSTTAPTVARTAAPTYALELPTFTLEALMEDPGSPQALAYSWLLADPAFESYTKQRQLQRFALATFRYATGSNWTVDSDWLSYDVNEC
jgi:hypothetical protein